MPSDKPVFWHQGLFLQPQHFQATDQFHQHQLKTLIAYSLPHFWGLQNLDVDESALTEKIFRVHSARLVFPGAILTAFPENAILSSKSFRDIWTDSEKPLNVYCGLKRWDHNGQNVTEPEELPDGNSARTMYCSPLNPEAIKDDYGDGSEARVRRLTYVLQIFFEPEIKQLADFHLVQVARLVQDCDRIGLSDRYVPPCLSLNSSKCLAGIVEEVKSRVIQRCQQLSEFKNPRKSGVDAHDTTYITLFLTMRSLNRATALLRHIAESPQSHPWMVYGVLFEILAELSCFDLSINALGQDPAGATIVPAYDHERLWDCFDAMREQIFGILDSLYIGPDYMTAFVLIEGHYKADIPAPFLGRNERYWIIIRSDSDLELIEQSIMSQAKIGAESRLTALLARALPGLRLIRDEGSPPGVPRQKNALYFRIDTNHLLWDDVVKSGSIAMYWDQAPETMNAQLVVLKR